MQQSASETSVLQSGQSLECHVLSGRRETCTTNCFGRRGTNVVDSKVTLLQGHSQHQRLLQLSAIEGTVVKSAFYVLRNLGEELLLSGWAWNVAWNSAPRVSTDFLCCRSHEGCVSTECDPFQTSLATFSLPETSALLFGRLLKLGKSEILARGMDGQLASLLVFLLAR